MKRQHRPAEKNKIAQEILAYLSAHPDAEDTLDGIMEWWLLEVRIKKEASLIQAALDYLIGKDKLEAVSHCMNEAKKKNINQKATKTKYRLKKA